MSKLGNRNMEYIAAIAEYQNITRAAEVLYISQPALSKFLSNLESELNVKLFNRQNNKYILTFEGERYLYYARQINSLNSQLETEMENIVSNEHGRLRISLPTHRSPTILSRILPPFCEKHPFVQLDIKEVPSAAQEKLLTNGEVDLSIVIDQITNPDIVTIPIKKEDVLLAVPSKHPLFSLGSADPETECPVISIEQVKDDIFILPNEGQHTMIVANKIFKDYKITPNIKLHIRSIETMLRLVSSNMGICMLSTTYARHIKTDNPVSFFRIDSPHAYSWMLVAYMKNHYQPEYFRDFINEFKEMESIEK